MRKAKIMVVEDETIVALDIRTRLEHIGYSVSAVVASGEKAIEKAAETHPDLVLMDIVLKGAMDGIEAAEQIRTRFDIPVIFATAHDESTLVERAKITEPYGYILKPFEERDLSTTIELALYKHEMEKRLKESEEKYRTFFNTSRDCVFITSSDGKWLEMNDFAVEFFGYENREELLKVNVSVLYENPEERGRLTKIIKQEGFVKEYPVNLRKKDGSIINALITSVAIKDENGNVIGYQGTNHDITERKKAEEMLKASEKRYRSLFEDSPVSLWLEDFSDARNFFDSLRASGVRDFRAYCENHPEVVVKCASMMKVLDVNSATLKLYKAGSKEELLGGLTRIFVPESFDAFRDNLIALFEGKTDFELEAVNQTLAGEIIHLIVRWSVLTGYEDPWSRVLVSCLDVTDRRRAEEALRTSEAQLSNAMKIAQLGYWEYDVANDLFTFNDHFYAIFRTSAEQVGGYTMSPARYAQLFVHPDDMAVVGIETRKAIETTDPHYSRQLEHRMIYADGEIGYIAVRFFIIKDNQGRTVKTYGANQDITARKRMERERERILKELEAQNAELDRFTYRVSHDLRSPLVTIQGFANMLQKDLERNKHENVESDLKYIANAATKMDKLLSDTLRLSRIGRVMNPPEDVSFGEIAEAALEQAAEQIKSSGVEISVAEDFPIVHVDKMRIEEVLVNLIVNSINYRGEQLNTKIEIGYHVEGEETVFFVKDNGIGIEKSQHEMVFELFYRVERSGEGTGAGLAIVRRIIEVHGGRTWIESEKDKGCTVCFTLPVQ